MSSQLFTVNSRKYDLSLRRSWTCELVRDDPGAIHLLGKFDDEVIHPELGIVRQGTISHETFFLDRWYNYFLFYEPTGAFRNFYFNICMPPSVGDGIVDYVDLDLDLIVWPDGRVVTLDVDEFEFNSVKYQYPEDVRLNALSALERLNSALTGQDSARWEDILAGHEFIPVLERCYPANPK